MASKYAKSESTMLLSFCWAGALLGLPLIGFSLSVYLTNEASGHEDRGWPKSGRYGINRGDIVKKVHTIVIQTGNLTKVRSLADIYDDGKSGAA